MVIVKTMFRFWPRSPSSLNQSAIKGLGLPPQCITTTLLPWTRVGITCVPLRHLIRVQAYTFSCKWTRSFSSSRTVGAAKIIQRRLFCCVLAADYYFELIPSHLYMVEPMSRIGIWIRIHIFLGLLDLDPDPLIRGMDPDPGPGLAPDPSIIKQN